MLNRYAAPEMYRHVLNGHAWVKHGTIWRQIAPFVILPPRKVTKLKYPVHFKSLQFGIPGIITNETPVVSADEKYWRMGEIVIYDGYNLDEYSRMNPLKEPD